MDECRILPAQIRDTVPHFPPLDRPVLGLEYFVSVVVRGEIESGFDPVAAARLDELFDDVALAVFPR